MVRLLSLQLLLLLTLTALVQVSWAEICFSDAECSSFELCIDKKCKRGQTGTGKRCTTSWDCLGSRYCRANECTCYSAFDCPGVEICSSGSCQLPSRSCVWSSSCPGDQVCINSRCDYCRYDSHCDFGQMCRDSKCIRAKSDNKTCTSLFDCAGSQRCVFGNCKYPEYNGLCEGSIDCPSSQVCNNNKCEDFGKFPVFLKVTFWILGVSFLTFFIFVIIKTVRNRRYGTVVSPPVQTVVTVSRPQPPCTVQSVPICAPVCPPPPSYNMTTATFPYTGPTYNVQQPGTLPVNPPPPVYHGPVANAPPESPAGPPPPQPPYNPYFTK